MYTLVYTYTHTHKPLIPLSSQASPASGSLPALVHCSSYSVVLRPRLCSSYRIHSHPSHLPTPCHPCMSVQVPGTYLFCYILNFEGQEVLPQARQWPLAERRLPCCILLPIALPQFMLAIFGVLSQEEGWATAFEGLGWPVQGETMQYITLLFLHPPPCSGTEQHPCPFQPAQASSSLPVSCPSHPEPHKKHEILIGD